MKYLSTLMLAFTLLFSACDKEEGDLETATGTVYYKPSSGTTCTYNIQLSGGRKIYPVNYEKIEMFLVDGKQVSVSFRKTSDYPSACSDAEAVILEDIR